MIKVKFFIFLFFLFSLITTASATDNKERCVPVFNFLPFETFPDSGAKEIPVTTNITLTFAIPPRIMTLEAVPDIEFNNITRESAYGLRDNKVIFHPAKPLQANTTYTVTFTYEIYRQSPVPTFTPVVIGTPGPTEFCLTFSTSWQFTTASYVRRGDVNDDGQVNITDALLVAKYSVGLMTLTPRQLAIADVNSDGQVNITDALLVALHSVGLRTLAS